MSMIGWKRNMPLILSADDRVAGCRRHGAMTAAAVWVAFGLTLEWTPPALAQPLAAKLAVNTPSDQTKMDPKFGVGAWIWADETHDQQLCRFWRGFEIPAGAHVVNARLRIAVDDSYDLFLDSREIGRGSGWHSLTEYDLTLMLEPGWHTLAVEGFNTFKQAGVLAGLEIKLADGRTIEIPSDQNWKVVPNTENQWVKATRARPNWPPATVVAAFGMQPWPGRPVILKVPQIYPIVLQFWQTGWFQIVVLSLFAAVGAICVWLIVTLALHSRIQQVVQRERARIARDLHDDLSGGLTQLVLIGEVVQSALPSGSEPRQQAAIGCEKARGMVQSMHDVIWAIDSKHDTMHDFSSHVCRYAESFLQPTSMRCHFDLDEEMSDFPFDLGRRRNLFLAVKEAIHNAVRHSGANELVLRIHRQGHGVVVTIEDNGRGFDPTRKGWTRNGLSNMMKRAADAGGTCDIVSQTGAGCRVVLTVPLVRPARGPTDWLTRLLNRLTDSKSRPVADAQAVGLSKTQK